MTLLNGSLDFYSRSSPLEHGGLLLLAIDGVALLLSFNSGGEEVFPKHCLVTTRSSCEEPTKQDDGVVLTWNTQVYIQLVLLSVLAVPQLAFNSGGEELFPTTV